MSDMNYPQRLALAQALYKVAGQLVDTKNPDSLRSEVDRIYKNQYEETGSKSFDIKINDVTVATYSIRFSKEEPAQTVHQFEVRDYVALARWFSDLDAEELRGYFGKDLQPFAEYWFSDTGELPDGCGLVEIVKLAQPKQYMGGTLKVRPELFAKAMGDSLPSGIMGLLGDAK